MEIAIKDLLKEFKDFRVLSGESGIENKVKTVSVMDAPDIYEWMKGGEFLITSGFSFREDPLYLLKLISELEKRNVAGLGIKMIRYLDELPEEVRLLSDELNFPIIDIPYSYAFTDIINPILSRIVNEQADRLSRSEKIHNTFTKTAINGDGIKSILDKLKEILDVDIYFDNVEFEEEYLDSIEDRIFLKNLASLEFEELEDKYHIYMVETSDHLYGYLVLNKDIGQGLDYIEHITLEHASTVLKLEIQKKISERQVEQKYRDEFIQDLIFNNIKTKEEVKSRASSYGWSIEDGLIALIVDIDDYKSQIVENPNIEELDTVREHIFRASKNIVNNRFLKAYYTLYSDIIVFLIEPYRIVEKDYMSYTEKVAGEIRDIVKGRSSFTVSIGIGSYQENIMDVHKSFQEAQKSIRIGRKVYGNSRVHIYSDLGIYKSLYDLSVSEDGREFYTEYLKKLVDLDRNQGTDYIKTIDTIVRNDWNLKKKTSQDLYLHYNTILYRFNKICEIQNDRFNNRDSKFKMELALRLRDISSNSILYMDNNFKDKTL